MLSFVSRRFCEILFLAYHFVIGTLFMADHSTTISNIKMDARIFEIDLVLKICCWFFNLIYDIFCIYFQRYSHPEFDYERPLSEVNSEISYDALSDKQFRSSNDIRMSSNRVQLDYDGSGGSHRGSTMSSENSESGRLMSGARRNLPKHQRPLTRYLPIMSADLDLRLHIESAGHQVTLCPHVIIDSFSCRGLEQYLTLEKQNSLIQVDEKTNRKYFVLCIFSYLHKLGATFHGWSKRWFVLDRQKQALIYYSDKSERKPRGGAFFTVSFIYLRKKKSTKSIFKFKLWI